MVQFKTIFVLLYEDKLYCDIACVLSIIHLTLDNWTSTAIYKSEALDLLFQWPSQYDQRSSATLMSRYLKVYAVAQLSQAKTVILFQAQ